MRDIFECSVVGVEMSNERRMAIDITGSAEFLRHAADRYLFAVQFTVVILEAMHRVVPCVKPIASGSRPFTVFPLAAMGAGRCHGLPE